MMTSNPLLPAKGETEKTVRGTVKRGLLILAVMGGLVLALAGFSAWLIHGRGPDAAVRVVHQSMSAARPWVVAGQIGAMGFVWYFWEPLVKRARFTPSVEAAWLAARNRLALWAIGLFVLGTFMWSSTR
jgi:hypothetical protein